MSTRSNVVFHKLQVILQRSLVECRNLALTRNFQQIYDLADTFEILPSLMNRWREEDIETVYTLLGSYQARYSETAYDYVSIWTMDEADFESVFCAQDDDADATIRQTAREAVAELEPAKPSPNGEP